MGSRGKRFLLTGTGDPAVHIDGTVIPLVDGRSLFIKMTGPANTVSAEADRIEAFLSSLSIQQ